MQDKRCSECSHSLETPTEGEIICIAHPPSSIVVEGNIRNVFPVMMGWGKCDEFIKGKTQKENDRKISKEIVKGRTIIKPKIITKKKEM